MIPVIVLVVLFVMLTLAGRLGVPDVWGWWTREKPLLVAGIVQPINATTYHAPA